MSPTPTACPVGFILNPNTRPPGIMNCCIPHFFKGKNPGPCGQIPNAKGTCPKGFYLLDQETISCCVSEGVKGTCEDVDPDLQRSVVYTGGEIEGYCVCNYSEHPYWIKGTHDQCAPYCGSDGCYEFIPEKTPPVTNSDGYYKIYTCGGS